jgi:RNA polymerase sigma-70 factor, ECF subfamily
MQNAAALAAADQSTADEEAALIHAARRDRAAFGLLYQCHVDHVYAYLRSRTQGDEDAADLTQQVFLQAMAALPRYQHNHTPFRAWLLRIARNLAINYHRHRPASVAIDLLPQALQPAWNDNTAARMEQSETLSTLFASLDAPSRELLILRFASQLTVKEIAAVISASEAATRMRLIRILRSLKEQYS